MKNKPVRLEDVASKAGVSITTVSHVINKTRYVKRETRELVLKVLDELGYSKKKPRNDASGHRFIGVVVANITEDYYISVVKAIETYATELGFPILLCDSEDDPEKEAANLASVVAKNPAGLVVAPVNSAKAPRKILASDLPIVFVDRKYTGTDRTFVGIDNFESGYFGASYLASKGCRKIAFIGYPETVYTVHQRSVGYRSFLQERMPECAPEILTLNYRQEDSNRLICEFIERTGPDGAICATSDICYELVGSIVEMGLSIPEQVKVVTYDDNKWLDYLKFPVSVITQPTAEIGSIAVDTLIRMILHPEETKRIGTAIMLETGFIDRL